MVISEENAHDTIKTLGFEVHTSHRNMLRPAQLIKWSNSWQIFQIGSLNQTRTILGLIFNRIWLCYLDILKCDRPCVRFTCRCERVERDRTGSSMFTAPLLSIILGSRLSRLKET